MAAPTNVGLTGTSNTDQPTFTFSSVTGAASYELYFSDNANGQVETDTGISGSPYTLPAANALTPGHSYSYWVGAVSTNGQGITWSAEQSLAIAALAAPTNVGLTGTSNTDQPTFTFSSVTGAASYELYFSDNANGQVETVTGVTGSPFTLPAAKALSPGHSYTYWVGAVSTNGLGITWSVKQSLAIAPLAAPTNIYPTGTVNITPPIFSWSTVADAGSYELYIKDMATAKVQTFTGLTARKSLFVYKKYTQTTPGPPTWPKHILTRPTSRMVGVSINTVTKLLVDVGTACSAYQNRVMRNLSCKR